MKRVLLLALTAIIAACGHFGMGGSTEGSALIVFHNESLDQANVYVVAPGAGDTCNAPASPALSGWSACGWRSRWRPCGSWR